MSPRADVRDPGQGGGEYVDRKGNYVVRYQKIADETMKPKSPDSPFKESLRVVFGIEGEEKQTVSLSVEVEDPRDDLWGFVPDPEAAPRNDEHALRQFVAANIVKETVTAYVSGFIQSRQAEPGTHAFERIFRIFRYQKTGRDGKVQNRLGMVAVTGDGKTATFYCPEPTMSDNHKGDEPDGDRIGPISADTYCFQYLQAFGLDWAKMKEELAEAEAYWPGHWNENGDMVPSLFPDLKDPWPGFLAMIDRHGWRKVKMEIEDHPTFGLGPKQIGKGLVKMVLVEGDGAPAPSREDLEFVAESARFKELYTSLTSAVVAGGKREVPFLVGNTLSEHGKVIAQAVLLPLLRQHPALSAVEKSDGTPGINVKDVPSSFTLDGLVCASFTAQRLIEDKDLDLMDPVDGIINTGDPSKLLAWAAEHVPEWAQAANAGEELL